MKKQFFIGATIVLFSLSLLLVGSATASEADYLLGQETVITGMVEQEGDQFVLQAISGEQYTITGQDLTDMVGKKVQATGEIVRGKNESRLNVSEVIEVQNEEMNLDNQPDLLVPLKDDPK